MESYKLIDKQKKKLIEMCRKLFPEYVDIDISRYEEIMTFWKKRPSTREWEMIHWYELCMTYLARKIFNHKNYPTKTPWEDSSDSLFQMICRQEWHTKQAYHPVDYLYKEFKKLKLK